MRREDGIQREPLKHKLSDLAHRTNPPTGGFDRRKTLGKTWTAERIKKKKKKDSVKKKVQHADNRRSEKGPQRTLPVESFRATCLAP